MPTIKKIPKTVKLIHALIQGQGRKTRKLTRCRRRSSCRGDARQPVVQRQCPTSRRSRRLRCSSAVQCENEVVDMPVVKGRRVRFRCAEDIEAHTDTVHRQDRWCSREGETPGSNSGTTDACDSDVRMEDPWSSHRSSTLKGSLMSELRHNNKHQPFVQFRRQRRFLRDNIFIEW